MTDKETRVTIRQIKVPIAGVTDEGKIYGTIPKEAREHIDLDELVEQSDEVRGFATIEFNWIVEAEETETINEEEIVSKLKADNLDSDA